MSDTFVQRPLGAVLSKRDPRDYRVHRFMPAAPEALPAEFATRADMPVYDQGAYGMCVGYTGAEVKEEEELAESGALVRMSAAFIYGNRLPTDHQGEGMGPREMLERLRIDGVCPFDMYPIQGDYPTCRDGITQAMRDAAKRYVIEAYARAMTVEELKAAVFHTGACMLAMPVYESFWHVKADGIVPRVQPGEKLYGFHAMKVYGWTADGYWRVQNSWGTAWGDGGHILIPLDYFTLADNGPDEQRMEGWTVIDQVIAKTFPDVDPTTEEGKAILRCAAAGIVQGFPDGEFKAKEGVTRGQLCLMLDRAGLTKQVS